MDDESPFNTLLSTLPFHTDADPGPETIWSLSRSQDGTSLAIFEQHDWISRRWGYVLWDYARLCDLDRRRYPSLVAILGTNHIPAARTKIPANGGTEGLVADAQLSVRQGRPGLVG